MDTHQKRPMPVAQYLRMSTEHQRYSTTNQREAIEKYVADHCMEVVRTYEDSGRSGLRLDGRPALQALLADAQKPSKRFEAVVVYDVSRWGRFQDVDESAYYEFVCRRAGVQVLYCAEPFGDLAGPMAVVVKSVKRAMAAEYSRELGVKVCAGQSHLTRRGFRMGGPPCFGLRRVLISETGRVKGPLGHRELKSIQTDRVILEPADELDVALVRLIFKLFVEDRMTECDVARLLNWCGYPGRVGLHLWCGDSVREVLRNEAYVGNLVYNRRSSTLRTKSVKNPPEKWVRAAHCFEPIVAQSTFDEAQSRLLTQLRHRWREDELVEIVRRIYDKYGNVSPSLFALEGLTTTSFIRHFGSVADACEAAGITPSVQLARQRKLLRKRHELKEKILDALAVKFRRAGAEFYCNSRISRRACIEGGVTISVRSTSAIHRNRPSPYWIIGPDWDVYPDYALVARVDVEGKSALDYFLLPFYEARSAIVGGRGQASQRWVERYRFSNLDMVCSELEHARNFALVTGVCQASVALERRRRRVLGIKKVLDMTESRAKSVGNRCRASGYH